MRAVQVKLDVNNITPGGENTHIHRGILYDGLVTVHRGSVFVVINSFNVRHLGRVNWTIEDAVNTDTLHYVIQLLTQK